LDGGRLVESKFYATGGASERRVSGANVGKPAGCSVAIDAVEEVSFAGVHVPPSRGVCVRVIDGSPCADAGGPMRYMSFVYPPTAPRTDDESPVVMPRAELPTTVTPSTVVSTMMEGT
jgi:hypothetical protein